MADDVQQPAAAVSAIAPVDGQPADPTAVADSSNGALQTAAAAPAPSAPLFKRKSHKQTAARRPLSSTLNDEEDEKEKGESIDAALEQTRLLQWYRAKQHSATVSSNIDALLHTAADEHSHGGNTARLTSIGATFQAEEATTDVVEERMRQYIEEQVEKRRQDSNSAKRPREEAQLSSKLAADDAAGSEQAKAEAAVLNDVAPLLRRKAVLDEKDEASAERWLRGIAEVQLPMEHRMHNVERTEAARARLSHSNRSSSPHASQAPGALPANYNSNFAHHKKEWDSAMRAQWKAHTEAMEKQRAEMRAAGIKVEEPKEKGRGRGRGGGGFGPDAASDSRVVDRFIKRFKNK